MTSPEVFNTAAADDAWRDTSAPFIEPDSESEDGQDCHIGEESHQLDLGHDAIVYFHQQLETERANATRALKNLTGAESAYWLDVIRKEEQHFSNGIIEGINSLFPESVRQGNNAKINDCLKALLTLHQLRKAAEDSSRVGIHQSKKRRTTQGSTDCACFVTAQASSPRFGEESSSPVSPPLAARESVAATVAASER